MGDQLAEHIQNSKPLKPIPAAAAHARGAPRIMKAILNPDGVILNAAVLTVDAVAHKRVLCPACGQKVFQVWPEGWDAHAATVCSGLTATGAKARKEEYRAALGHLFRRGSA